MKNVTIILCISMLFSCLASGQMVEKQGVGQMTYEGMFNIKTSDKQQALSMAKLNALRSLTADFDTAKQIEYGKVVSIVEKDLDRFVPTLMILDEEVDKKAKSYTVVGRASINLGLIEMEISKVSAVKNVAEKERSYLTFIFLSRKAVSVKQYDAKVSQRTDTNSVEEISESQAMDGTSVAASGEAYSSSSSTSGGSTEIKADKIEYDVSSSDDINTTVLRVFANAGYEVVEAEMVADETGGQMDLHAFVSDFSQGDDISAATRKGAANGCRDLDIRFLSIGKLDIGQNLKDPVTGMIRVYVNVNAKVYDVSKKFPKTVSSVGPVQYSGIGPTQDVAQRNALQTAGEQAASELMSQMRAKDLY
jgi:hypothetical protein